MCATGTTFADAEPRCSGLIVTMAWLDEPTHPGPDARLDWVEPNIPSKQLHAALFQGLVSTSGPTPVMARSIGPGTTRSKLSTYPRHCPSPRLQAVPASQAKPVRGAASSWRLRSTPLSAPLCRSALTAFAAEGRTRVPTPRATRGPVWPPLPRPPAAAGSVPVAGRPWPPRTRRRSQPAEA